MFGWSALSSVVPQVKTARDRTVLCRTWTDPRFSSRHMRIYMQYVLVYPVVGNPLLRSATMTCRGQFAALAGDTGVIRTTSPPGLRNRKDRRSGTNLAAPKQCVQCRVSIFIRRGTFCVMCFLRFVAARSPVPFRRRATAPLHHKA